VGALIIEDGRILLIERGREPLKGQWSLPGGAVETGERLEDAVAREVWEETGLRVQPETVAVIFERIMPDAAGEPEYHYVLVDFICRVLGGTLCAGDDSNCARWFSFDELEELSLTPGTIDVIRRIHAHGPSLAVLSP
jgi:ADP-ribose pyrophosphatase YjhB (NUDIX family)